MEYHVITAENGKVALEKLATIDCQPILSDIMMPIMDGYGLVEKVKTDHRFNHLPIIALTARTAFADKMKALRIGVDDYLTKPFLEEELFVRIENLLRNAKNRQEALAEVNDKTEILPTEQASKVKPISTPLKGTTPEL